MLKEGEEEGATEDDLGEELESSLALAEDEQGGPSLGFILGTCTNTLQYLSLRSFTEDPYNNISNMTCKKKSFQKGLGAGLALI